MSHKLIKIILTTVLTSLLLLNCKGGDARKNPPDPRERVKKNLEEGKGFRLDTAMQNMSGGGGSFEFASSNELWRASLDIIDFMPLTSANYSGGIIITDWYSENPNEAIKVTIRFLSNEVRSDALDIKIFYKKCENLVNCTISDYKGNLKSELTKEILKKAAIYKKQYKDKNFKPYAGNSLNDD
ncbi:DUF3576 domain-containing protein [Candidatus Pelagibacter communis]|uniref:DUF3576 domain-containing protein n=1 Tax=Pelagibacter ubique TaxID=198252 RepID=UPI0021D2AA5D|nr:DUF3576 domain-containing protein [Candidatus Pelagibacter ubique]